MSLSMVILLFGAAIVATVLALAWIYRSSSRAPAVPDDDEPVAIVNGGEVEVAIMASKLEASGVRAFTRNPGGVYPYRSPLYGWEVLVRYADVDEARAVLELDGE